MKTLGNLLGTMATGGLRAVLDDVVVVSWRLGQTVVSFLGLFRSAYIEVPLKVN